MKLAECANCGFYVASNDKFCPDCGVSSPIEKLEADFETSRSSFTVIFAVAFAFIFAFGTLYVRSDGQFDNLSQLPFFLIGGFLAGLIISVPAGLIFSRQAEKTQSANRFPTRDPNTTLRGVEDTIQMRNIELEKQYRQIEKLLKRGVRSGNKIVRENVLAARGAILTQLARYELEKQKINLIRLQNRFLPVVYYQNLSSEEMEILAAETEDSLNEIENIRQNLTNDYAIEFPAATAEEKKDFLGRLDETQANGEKLRESLLEDQAAFALRNTAPRQTAFDAAEINRRIDVSNIQMSLTDFSASFKKLDREYETFQARRELEENF